MTGIYCIETDWTDGEDQYFSNRYSVEKPLSFVAETHKAGMLIRRSCEEPDQFPELLDCWANRSDWDYPILYLGFHGFTKGIQVGKSKIPFRDYVRLEQFTDLVTGRDGSEWRWEGCLIHFAACATMNADESDIASFIEATKVEVVSGYSKDVDWMASMAFDMMYLHTVLHTVGNDSLNANNMRLCRDKLLNSPESKDLARTLGFTMAIKDDFA